MTPPYSLHYSPTFKLTLDRLTHFLERKFSPQVASKAKADIRSAINKTLKANPLIAPVSERLVSLGITEYRQLVIGQNLIFFRVQEEDVFVLAVMDARQSIDKLLYEVCLTF